MYFLDKTSECHVKSKKKKSRSVHVASRLSAEKLTHSEIKIPNGSFFVFFSFFFHF